MRYLLLYIDGVFNPFMGEDLPGRGFVVYQNGWVTWAVDLVHHAEWLRAIEEEVTIVWASSWEEESNKLASFFGLENADLPYIHLRRTDSPTWKLESVREWVDSNTSSGDQVVWVDDELESDAFAWAETVGVCLVRTDPAYGVTIDEWNGFRRFFGLRDQQLFVP